MTGLPDGRGATARDAVGRAAVERAVDGDALETDAIRGYAPLVNYDALDERTVVVRLTVARPDVAGVAAMLRAAGAVSIFELTGTENLFAVCRFTDDAARQAFLAALATDDRVTGVEANVALRTVVEGDARGLL
ncbi:hypothetical protein [Natronomonas sp. EA1]|uniref:hypothetical protein n=1 Tax=Natronomonas sp. EA1 TaxID=3421655 RepID=UPI003EBC6D22